MSDNAIPIPTEFAPFVTREFVDPLTDTRCMELSFPNGYGASLIHGRRTYDLELAILSGAHICATTPIESTGGIIGWLTPERLAGILAEIMALGGSK